MEAPRHFAPIACLVAAFTVDAEEPLTAEAKTAASQPAAAELEPLQGKWEGVAVGDKAQQKITITVTGDSFHFYRDPEFWFETTITLPAGTDPQQLHATIKNSSPPTTSIGEVVGAIFRIEDGTLTLIAGGGGAEQTPKNFETTADGDLTRYELRKVPAEKKHPEPPKSK